MAPKSLSSLWPSTIATSTLPVSPPFWSSRVHPATFTTPPSSAGENLAHLPWELQCLVLSYLPIRSLVRGLARTSHHWAGVVDDHVRREIQRLIGGGMGRPLPGDCTLMFEAQRPIDTLTHKHRLYFSHFGVTNSTGGAYTTTANFSFQPIEQPSDAKRSPRSPSYDHRRDVGDNKLEGESRPAVLRNLPDHLAGRVRPEHCTSSLIPEDDEGTARGRPIQPTSSRASRASSPTHALLDAIHHPLDAYDWAGPVSSAVHLPSTSRSRSRPDGAARSRPRRRKNAKPTYRMQLDPLDSFETWILTLTVRASSSAPLNRSHSATETGGGERSPFENFINRLGPAATTGPAGLELSRAMRWERRVAEGLDRVYRDWFHRPETADLPPGTRRGAAMGADTTIHPATHVVTPELISTFGALNQAFRARNTSSEDEAMDLTDVEAPIPSSSPRRRILEFDNASCVLHLQPHACSSPQLLNLHPTLAYYYNPSPPVEPDTGRTTVVAPSSSYPPGSVLPVPLLNPSSSVPTTSTSSFSGQHAANQGLYGQLGYGYDPTSRYHALHSRLQASHRVELTWHAESIEINAPRLLSVLEEVDAERIAWEVKHGIASSTSKVQFQARQATIDPIVAWVTPRRATGERGAGGAGPEGRRTSGASIGEAVLVEEEERIIAGVDARRNWRTLSFEESTMRDPTMLGMEVD